MESSLATCEARIAEHGTDIISASIQDAYGPTTPTKRSQVSYDNWVKHFQPLLSTAGVSSQTVSKIKDCQSQGKIAGDLTVALFSDSGIIIYEKTNENYAGMQKGATFYVCLKISSQDAKTIQEMLT